MKVLMITGDKNFLENDTAAYKRYMLQKSAVEDLKAVFWGKGAFRVPKAAGYDVVTSQDPFWRGLVAWRSAKAAGAKLNLQVHTDLSSQSFVKRILAKFLLKKANSVRVVSEKIKAQVVAMGVTSPIHVLPVYVHIDKFRSVERKPHLRKTMLWYGRFEKEKDPLLALDIFKKVLASIPDSKLIMLGEGSLGRKLHKKAVPLELHESVIYPWEDPVFYLETADVVVCTSKHESWGASIVESLAAGVPVVAPDVGVAKEAGATIAPRAELSKVVLNILSTEPKKAELKLTLLDEQSWTKAWAASLL
jgi:glycosyltransferase involved in cell wall biosynthesis